MTGKLAALAATLFLAASPVLAQDTDASDPGTGTSTTTPEFNMPLPGNPVSATNPDMMMTEGAWGIFYEEDGATMRGEEDFMAAFEAATPEDQETVSISCEDWQQERVGFLDSVSANCRAITGPEAATE